MLHYNGCCTEKELFKVDTNITAYVKQHRPAHAHLYTYNNITEYTMCTAGHYCIYTH